MKLNKKVRFTGSLGAFLMIALVFAAAAPALATTVDGGGGGGGSCTEGTLGGVICNMVASSSDMPFLFSAFSYMFGLVIGFLGILKLKDHVENPNNTPIWDPVKRLVAAGASFALPTVLGAAYRLVAGDGAEAAGGDDFNSGGATDLGLDGMMVKLIGNVWEPMQMLLFGFCYLAGIILIIIGISRLLKTEQDGPRGPTGIGTIFTFIVGGALMAVDKIMGSSLGSLFGGPNAMYYASLAYTDGMDEAMIGHANAVIAAVIAFVAILGWISFIRGFFILRGVSEGNSQASMMAAVTHILGGAIAVNLGGFISAVQETLGISGMGLGLTFG